MLEISTQTCSMELLIDIHKKGSVFSLGNNGSDKFKQDSLLQDYSDF